MPTKFFTNHADNSLLKKFEGIFSSNPNIRFFDALVGYFRSSGYFSIRPYLDKVSNIRILAGINVDFLTGQAQQAGLEFFKNHEKTKEEYLKDVLADIEKARYDEETEKGILLFISDIINKKIEIRAHPERKLHAKVYIFYDDIHNLHNKQCAVITGSSNLSDAGIGASKHSNYEFNVELSDYDDVKFAWDEFEMLWNESVPFLPVDAEKIKKQSYLKDDYSPFELYIKLLIEYFGRRVEYDPFNIEMVLPPKFTKLNYQIDAANQGYSIMMKHNGFILADVVGLGKTVVACMIVKNFIWENGTHTRILVVCPPAIKTSWILTTRDFQIDGHFDFITIGSLHKVLNEENHEYRNAEDYDLIIVDESHKFRNDYTDMYVQLQEICKRPRKRPAENGDVRKKVILVSATPLNNRPQDIENQLYLFQTVNEKYKKLSAETPLNIPKLKQLFNELRSDIIEQLVIRRTRRDIEKNPEYLENIKKQGLTFPKVDDPEPVFYKLDKNLTQLFADTVSLITGIDENENETDGVKYFRYRAIEFLINEKDRKQYGDVGQISQRLTGIMRVLLVKRLESSFYAFKESLRRFQKANRNMIDMFEKDKVFIAPKLDINKLLEEGYSFDEIEQMVVNAAENNRTFKVKDFKKEFPELLKADQKKIDELVKRWNKVDNDPKLDKFIKELKKTFLLKKNNISGKLVIFTESKETAKYIEGGMSKAGYKKILVVSSENRKEREQTIRKNFDANVEEEKWENEFDYIITTEVLAEGVNLHRSNVILNYDVPWNSTRLMQRIGRVNRIGTKAERIFVYNFYPSAEGDFQINLVNTALRKLQAFHTAFGEDNRIFSHLEEVGEGALFGSKIQKEESEILEYLFFLRDFRRKHPKMFNEIASLPNKARAGRSISCIDKENLPNTDSEEVKMEINKATVTYLKSDNHPGVFYFITEAMNAKELSFLQAVKLFEANEKEKAIKLHEKHFEQVQKAFENFISDKNQQAIAKVTSRDLSRDEKTANRNLTAALKIATTEQKRNTLLRVIDSIKQGKFTALGLPREINDFFSSNASLLANPANFLDKLFDDILNRYDFSDSGAEAEQPPSGIVNPKIVLTASFS
jgi:superfamily II DNA or RNA helicase